MKEIKIVVADRNWMIRDAIVQALAKHPDKYVITGTAGNGPALIDLLGSEEPDIVLLDFALPVIEGVELLRIFAKDHRQLSAVVLSDSSSAYNLSEVIACGGAAFMSRNSSGPEITRVIDSVARYRYYFPDDAGKSILTAMAQQKEVVYMIDGTKYDEREIQVLKALCRSTPESEIAGRLNMSKHWVDHTKRNLKEKANCKTTVALALFAAKHNIIRLQDL